MRPKPPAFRPYLAVAEAKRGFEAPSAGGTVGVPLEPTFRVEIFGMVTDRFGTPWLVNGGKMVSA